MLDTSGQERLNSSIRDWFRDASAFILVFDITSYYTYSGIKRYIPILMIHTSDTTLHMELCLAFMISLWPMYVIRPHKKGQQVLHIYSIADFVAL